MKIENIIRRVLAEIDADKKNTANNLEAIDFNDLYKDALDVFNTLSEDEKWDVCPNGGVLKNVSSLLYRHVIKNKAFVDLYPFEGYKNIGFVILAVNPKYRNQGLTKRLLNQTKQDCKKLGIKKLIWKCSTKNQSSFNSALSNGFKQTFATLEYKI